MAGSEDVVVHSGYTVLRSQPDGAVDAPRHGLLYRDARLVSRLRHLVDGTPAELVRAWRPEADRWEGILQRRLTGGRAEGPRLPQDTVEVHLRRTVGPGMVEAIEVMNHGAEPWSGAIRVEVDGDFADALELRRGRRQRGHVRRTVGPDGSFVELCYQARVNGTSVELGFRLEVLVSTSPPSADDAGLTFAPRLAAGGRWAAILRYAVLEDGRWLAPEAGVDGPPASGRQHQRTAWRATRTRLRGEARLTVPFERAADDLFDLRAWELEARFLGSTDGARWILNAGMPDFAGLFGRDVLTAGWQSAMLGPRSTRGALAAIAATQSRVDDPWRDAEPGKLIHEARSGPLTALGLDPRDGYYGTQTTPAMFVLALSELWHWTGDDAILRRYIGTARRAMRWALTIGDRDGDGFLEYATRSSRGLRNHGWKDSDEAIRHDDGAIVEGPVATVEEQAFHILALERLAEIETALEEDAAADELLTRATDLRRRWHHAFWMRDADYYALALDGAKRQVRSIASNAGHALGAGVVPREHARTVADRLLAPDLFSGWGVRSLSARHPSYNPFAYHLGAVWPVEQATFALGCKRYGLAEHVDRLVEGVVAAAVLSNAQRLPEALTGHPRADVPMPVPYPGANRPQAWSAGALVQIVQIMLGLYPFAPLRTLAVVDPRLPEWLPELTVERLRVGTASVDLEFRRRRDGSAAWKVHRRRGGLLVIPAGAPGDVEDGILSRVDRAILRMAPGRLARAARIALGLR